MLKKLHKHFINICITLVLVALLALIRLFQNQLFYDPLITYFKYQYHYSEFPEYDPIRLYLHLIARYGLNSTISLGIIYVVFRKKAFVKLAAVLYIIALIILLICFQLCIQFISSADYQYLFYVRRFLIQPLLVMLFIPAFYYQKKFV